MPPARLTENIAETAFAFRGYNITNLGRTREFLAHAAYAPTMRRYLDTAAAICADVIGRRVDLVRRVEEGREATLDEYAEAVALIAGVELAQVQLLEEFHGVRFAQARLCFGYSLGELVAVSACGIFALDESLRVPLAMAEDCASLAHDVTMGVLFSRGPVIDEHQVRRLCLQITSEGKGVIGVSAHLSPNTMLVLGQGQTIGRLKEIMHDFLPSPAHLRLNDNRWPPLHTPIVRQRHVADRASVMMDTMKGGLTPPCPPILSLVTGKMSYNDVDARDLLRDWVDHPQRLWDAVYGTLAAGVKTIIHVGPEPNLVPATFTRLGENVEQQTTGRSLGKLGLRAVSGLAQRPWLAAVLPSRAALLRAPMIRQVILEDWLLAAPVQ
jgi:[acyl-carrier-protein] S-malonyltransferase